jgi:hypothetical protein
MLNLSWGCSLPTLTLENWGKKKNKKGKNKNKNVRNLKPTSGFRNRQGGAPCKGLKESVRCRFYSRKDRYIQ